MNRLETKHINLSGESSVSDALPIRENYTSPTQGTHFSENETAFSPLQVTVSSRAISRLPLLFIPSPMTTRYCNHSYVITLANTPNASTIIAAVKGAYPLGASTVTFFDYTIIDSLSWTAINARI